MNTVFPSRVKMHNSALSIICNAVGVQHNVKNELVQTIKAAKPGQEGNFGSDPEVVRIKFLFYSQGSIPLTLRSEGRNARDFTGCPTITSGNIESII
jgi:hypothetical protein